MQRRGRNEGKYRCRKKHAHQISRYLKSRKRGWSWTPQYVYPPLRMPRNNGLTMLLFFRHHWHCWGKKSWSSREVTRLPLLFTVFCTSPRWLLGLLPSTARLLILLAPTEQSKKPYNSCLGYVNRGLYSTTQLYGDYFINHYQDPY